MAKKKDKKHRGTFFPSRDASSPMGQWLVPILLIAAILLLVIGVGSTSNQSLRIPPTKAPPTATGTVTPTKSVSPCSPDMVREDVEKVDAIMREFYDASALASQTPIDKLLEVIPTLQEIRRRAENLKVSHCLDKLRSFQLSHMNMVINTMLAFMGKADEGVLVEGVVQARLLNEEYKKEKARLLGLTYVPPATRTPLPVTGTPGTVTGTVTATAIPPSATR